MEQQQTPSPVPQPTERDQQPSHSIPQPNQTTAPYQGWLVSNNIIKRSFAVLGHYMLANIIIMVPIFIMALLAGLA